MTNNELKEARQMLSLTQEQLADEIGASLASVRNWEQGRCKVNRVAARQIQRLLDSQGK
jgi:DNA-binding transcriptional regulator YiaG